LYNYTPYQPNAAALSAGWGTAPCGAYGNRNFYLYFTGWFGSTRNPSYYATAIRQSPYPKLNPGQGKTVYIDYKNNGSLNWYDDVSAPTVGVKPIHLAASKPINRKSAFSFRWPSAGRPN